MTAAKALYVVEGKWETAREALEKVVRVALANRISRKTMQQWLVEAGYSDSHAANTVNSLLVSIQGPDRKSGAGPKAPKQALDLLQYAVKKYGNKATKYLLAAWRLSKSKKSK